MGKTILHILNTGSYSGAENVVITIIEGFRRFEKYDFRFIYVSFDGAIREVLEKHNIEFEPISSMSLKEIKRVRKKYNPDIIHAHDFTASIICAAAAGKTPVISHIHNNSPWIKTYCANSFIYGLSCLKYRRILGVSESVFEEYVFGRLIRNKSEVIGNPIDIEKIKKAAENTAGEAYDVVFLGRLTEQKNPLRFIDIIGKVKEIHPGVSAVMIGEGDLRSAVERKVRQLGLEENITLKGFVSNPYGILKNSKMLCIPSVWEGFGLAAVEALALGKPVLATPVGGLPGIVNDRCGGLFETDETFAKEIVKLCTDKDYYECVSKYALCRANEIDNIREYIGMIGSFYKNIGR
ncbi:MAG: glycosyltransferase [bacterium]|nr:glycosyltransferase [bacterium]